MKTVMWLYLFIFVAFFDLHAQYPMLTPFAISLGAAPSFIGFIMGIYSLTHLPGNVLAGYSVDRYGSKPFIVLSLVAAGILLLLQSRVTDPWQLLAVRSASGFALAFLSPACLALLAKLAKDRVHQSKLMSGNGLVHTLASVVSPAAGALLVAKFGFTAAFAALGWGLIVTGILAIWGVKEAKPSVQLDETASASKESEAVPSGSGKLPWLVYGVPLALSCSQGILFFELPLHSAAQSSVMHTGILFSVVSLGALITLAMVFLNRVSPLLRTAFGTLALSFVFFGLAVDWPLPLPVSLLLVGMCKGVVFPALAALLASVTDERRYGRVFSVLSIAFSIGAFFGPIVAGQTREMISPFYIAFVVLMFAWCCCPPRFATERLPKPNNLVRRFDISRGMVTMKKRVPVKTHVEASEAAMDFVIIVEGKNDRSRLARLLASDVPILCTFGTPGPKQLQQIIKKVGDRAVYIYTDNDASGKRIRAMLSELFPDAEQLYTKAGYAGVEGTPDEHLIRQLEKAGLEEYIVYPEPDPYA